MGRRSSCCGERLDARVRRRPPADFHHVMVVGVLGPSWIHGTLRVLLRLRACYLAERAVGLVVVRPF